MLATGLIVGAMAACGTAGSSSPNAKGDSAGATAEMANVRIGLDSFPLATVVYAAQMQGFFKKHNINPTIDTYSVGADTLNAALAGKEDFGWGFDFGTLAAMRSNRLRYVARIAITKPGWHLLAVRSNIAQPADLQGKTMGIVEGTEEHFVTVKYLQKVGVPVSSVHLQSFGTPFELVAALRTGKIDGAWVFGPARAVAKNSPGVRILTTDGAVLDGGIHGFLIATQQMTDQHPEVVSRVLDALIDAQDWLSAGGPAAAKKLASFAASKLHSPESDALGVINEVNPSVGIGQGDIAQLSAMAQFVTKIKPGPPIEVPKYFDPTPLRQADARLVTLK